MTDPISNVKPPSQPTDRQILRALLRTNFLYFVYKVFTELHSGAEYLHNWHIEAIIHALWRVETGEEKRLLITQPPRSLKSIITSVAWPAWRLGRDPSHIFLCISYSQDLSTELSEKFRRIVESDWYKDLFPNTKFIKLTQTDAQTDKGGRRFSTSIGGTLTGRGADTIIIDDPLKADEAASETARRAVIEWFEGTLQSRLNNQITGSIIVVMQRLHEEDLAGSILSKWAESLIQNRQDKLSPTAAFDGLTLAYKATKWAHLNLPAIATEDALIPIGFEKDGRTLRFHHRKEGSVLHEEHLGLTELARLKRDKGSQRFSAQYQQDPLPLDGNLIKNAWMPRYSPEDLQRLRETDHFQVVQSWDIATTTTANSDYSVCTTWLKFQRNYYLVHVLRVRREFPELKKLVDSHCQVWDANVRLIEKDGLGLPLYQALCGDMTSALPRPIGIRAKGDKMVRMEAQSATIESGQMHIPGEAPWLADYLKELLGFPHKTHDDQVDSTSQFLNWAAAGQDYVIPVGAILVHA